jgi:hypothetical protein
LNDGQVVPGRLLTSVNRIVAETTQTCDRDENAP